MSPAQSKKPPRLSFQVTPKMEKRVAKLLASEIAERPFITLSDVLREALDAGLRTKEAPGTNSHPNDPSTDYTR